MEKQALSSNLAEVHFAKVVANPTPLSWSQIYNAGSLFAVLSLQYKEVSGSDIPVLSMVGKDVFNSLEEEYFTLEEKNFQSVKEAIIKSLEKVPPSVENSFILATIPPGKDHILYLYLIGKGSILLKRGEKVGHLLKGSEDLQSASGVLEDNDMLVLQTDEFSEKIPHDALVSSLGLPPNDVAEVFGAKIHQGSEGKEAALILMYHKKLEQEDFTLPVLGKPQETLPQEEKDEVFPSFMEEKKTPTISSLLPIFETVKNKLTSFFPKTTPSISLQLNHKKKIYLSLAAVLIVALVISGFLAFKRQEDAKLQAEVEMVLSEAGQKYNEGEVLAGLNKNLAAEDFEQAEAILEENKSKFPAGSTQRQEVDAMLEKVQKALSSLTSSTKVTPLEVALSQSPALLLSKSKNADFVTKDESSLYYLSGDNVSSTNTSLQNTKSLIKSDQWQKAAGLGVFGNNLYVLDVEANQIFKFVPVGSSYSKSDYLTTDTDVSDASSMAIDSSIWVLLKNGAVKKFTRGKEDPFNLSGLTSPLSTPTRIFTNADTNSLYILDNGNARIVVVAKNGTYSSELKADILKDAKDFEVLEKEKKIYVLSADKLYELPLN